MRMFYKAMENSDCHSISRQTDWNFIFLIQRALLMALKEKGQLNEMQYRQAEGILLKQRREYIAEHSESLKDD